MVPKICKVLNISILDFYSPEFSFQNVNYGGKKKPTPVSESELAIKKIAVIQKILHLGTNELETLNQLADSVLEKRDG